MRLERFEQWFAVRSGHSDEEVNPARLTYDPDHGVSMSAIRFAEPQHWYSHPDFTGETITGYLDYQRPATVVSPFIRSASPGTMAAGHVVRASYEVVGNGVLLDMHLTSLSDACFLGFKALLPSFHAWVAPALVHTDLTNLDGLPALSMQIAAPSHRDFDVAGARVQVDSVAATRSDPGSVPVFEQTRLSVALPEPVTYERALRLSAATDTVFAFLVGTRLEYPVIWLPVAPDAASRQDLVAEAHVVPTWRRERHPPHWLQRFSVERGSPVPVEGVLAFCLEPRENILYLMDLVLASEGNDTRADDCYGEMLGCLEDFDTAQNGSGADPALREAKRRLSRLVAQHGTADDVAACNRIGRAYRNAYSLRQRLERLVGQWRDDGFRGNPDLARIVAIRNIKPHGRGHELSLETFREINIYLPFLCALARYHVLRRLGFDRTAIAEGFTRMANRYGPFVPEDLRPNYRLPQPSDEMP